MDFFNTTVGKTVKVLLYVVVSGAISGLIAFVSGHPELFNPYIFGVINLVLVAGKNFFDPKVRNI